MPNPTSLADVENAGIISAPPHLLWETLETAFSSAATDGAPPSGTRADTERLAITVALPIVVGVSLLLWVAIVELVLTR